MRRRAVPLGLLLGVAALGAFLRHEPRPAVDRGAAQAVAAMDLPEPFLRAVSAALGGGVGWALAAGVASLLAATRGGRAGILAFAAFAATHGVTTFAKALFDRARPDAEVLAGGTSYPSGHVAAATALAASVALPWITGSHGGRRALGLTCVLATAGLMGLSRVGLGRHFATDVLGGACLGLAVVLVLSQTLDAGQRGSQATTPPGRK